MAVGRLFLVSVLLLAWLPQDGAQVNKDTPKNTPKTGALIIRLEQKKAEHVSIMRPEHVFDQGDIVRFRLTSGIDGYLYVINQSSSGTYSPLFPAAGTRADNHILKTSDYLVPSTDDGWFQVEGPPGFEVVYFLLSPMPLNLPPGPDQPAPTLNDKPAPTLKGKPLAAPGSLKPRCNDAIFQARGECIDDSAGPAPLARGTPLPPQISSISPHASRDIIFTNGDEENSITASAPTLASESVVYTFRLAHH